MSQPQAAARSSRRGAAPAANGNSKNAQGQVVQERTTKGSSASAPRVVHFVVGTSLPLSKALSTVGMAKGGPGRVEMTEQSHGRAVGSLARGVTERENPVDR
jgi:hypothetical protein